MKVTCEKCGATLTAPDDASGKTVRCPKCKHTFRVDVLELTDEIEGTPSPAPASALDELAGAAQQPSPAGPPRLGPRRLKSTINPPEYKWLHLLGGLCQLCGGIIAVLAILLLIPSQESSELGTPLKFIVAGVIFVTGLAYIGFGQVYFALRDIARNTFYLRKL